MEDLKNCPEEEQFRRFFPLEEDQIAIDFFWHFIDANSEVFLRYFEHLLDAKGLGFEAMVGCSFDIEGHQCFSLQGVRFTLALTCSDPETHSENYHETFVPYQTFLDMMRFIAQWRLKNFPDEEPKIHHVFSIRNLDFSPNSLGKGNGDSGKAWWNKCQLRHIEKKPNRTCKILNLKYGR